MSLINIIRNFLKKITFILFFNNKNFFYKNFYGSLHLPSLIFFNLLFPGRSIIRYKNKRLFFPKSILKIDDNIYVEAKNKTKDEIVHNSYKKLNKYGSIVIHNFFDEKTMSNFENENEDEFNEIDATPSNFTSRSKNLYLTKSLSKMWLNETLIRILENYIKKMPTARTYPDISSVTPLHNYNPEIKTDYAGVWHVDHATLIQIAIFFTDVTSKDTHMETIVGSHTYPNITVNGPISNEYVKSKNFKIGRCIGPRGSVQIHCGNIYHRIWPINDSPRTWVKFHFCSGTNILFDKKKMKRLISKEKKFDYLNIDQKKIISGLIPKNQDDLEYDNNGYEFKNNILIKSEDPHYYKDSPGSFLWKK